MQSSDIDKSQAIYDAIVIGSGPSACSAAIYLARACRKTLLITGYERGGLLTTTTIVENYPGYSSIDGAELMEKLIAHTTDSGAELLEGECKSFTRKNQLYFEITIEKIDLLTAKYYSPTVIFATGAKPRKLELPALIAAENLGVSYCATCDGALYRDAENVFVIGGGDSANTSAIYLSKISKNVTLLLRKGQFRNENYLSKQVENTNNIKVLFNSEIRDVVKDASSKLTGIKYYDKTAAKEYAMEGEAVFINIGHVVRNELFEKEVELLETGHININYEWRYVEESKSIESRPIGLDKQGATKKSIGEQIFKGIESKNYLSFCSNMPGVFAVGDVVDHVYQQAIIGAGMGSAAALSAVTYLSYIKGKGLESLHAL